MALSQLLARPMKRSTVVLTAGVAAAVAAGSGLVASARREAPPPAPPGLPVVAWPADNPYSREKAELGRLLFFDKRLSSDGTVACASCHQPECAFADRGAVSEGIGKQKGRRNAPSVLNRAYGETELWDGRLPSLEAQAKAPLADRKEMTTAVDTEAAHRACLQRLRALPGYRARFRRAFGSEQFTLDDAAKALATFERTLLSGNSPYDRYRAGERGALSAEELRGMDLFFGRASCSACHRPPNFTSEEFLNDGVGQRKPRPDRGRYEVTHQDWEVGVFKTPSLREVERTAPYMHDGSLKTLEEVVDHYDRGGDGNLHQDDRLHPLHLTHREKRDLVAFMKALSGEGWQSVRAPRPEEFPR